MAYGFFLSFSNTLKVAKPASKIKVKKCISLLKIISTTDKKIPEVNVVFVLTENWVCLAFITVCFFVFKSHSDYNHLPFIKSASRWRCKHQSKVIIKERSCQVANLILIFHSGFLSPYIILLIRIFSEVSKICSSWETTTCLIYWGYKVIDGKAKVTDGLLPSGYYLPHTKK